MKFFCVKTFVALIAIIGLKSEAASLKNGLLGKAIVRRTSQGCVYTCADVTTPDQSNLYAFCADCSKFVQCDNFGQTFVQNCQPGLLWDDSVKVCNFPSSVSCTPTTTAAPPPTTTTTTTAGPTTTTTAPTTTTTLPTGPPGHSEGYSIKQPPHPKPVNTQIKECINDCDGIADGDYQSCNGCDVYASCVAEAIFDNRPCPASLVWDDFLKLCNYTSTSCP